MYQIIWHNRMSRDRERTTRKQKAQIIWRHKCPNIKFWETLSDSLNHRHARGVVERQPAKLSKGGPEHTRHMQCLSQTGSKQASQQPRARAYGWGRHCRCSVSLRGVSMMGSSFYTFEMRLWTFKFKIVRAHAFIVRARSCIVHAAVHRHARTNYVPHKRARYTGTRARISRTPRAQWIKIDSHAQQKITKKTVSLRNELYDNNNIDDTSTVPINDELSRRAETCCKSAFLALFDKQNCNKLLLREPPFKT